MNTNPQTYKYGFSGILEELEAHGTKKNKPWKSKAFDELEQRVYAALETYSNVHRGTGQFSSISTTLYEHARNVVLEFLALDPANFLVLFCTPYGAEKIIQHIPAGSYHALSSNDIGLPLGLAILAVRKKVLPAGIPFQTGGSVVRMVSPDYVIWSGTPQKFEPGTPFIINAITFAVALVLSKKYGTDCFLIKEKNTTPVGELFTHDDFSATGKSKMGELVKMLIGRNFAIPLTSDTKNYINFDHAASTPTFFPVWNTVQKIWRQASSNYTNIIHESKKIVAGFLEASPESYEIIFTGNTTEAINITSRFLQKEFESDGGFIVVNTLLEHNSNELPWRYIPGSTLIRVSANKDGFVHMGELETLLKKHNLDSAPGTKQIRLITVSGASNVLGTFNDLKALSTLAHQYGARIMVDAAQLVAHKAIYMENWDIDYLVFSGHKIYAPFGSGALVIRKSLLPALTNDLESVKKSGEANISGIAAMGKAMALLQQIGMDNIEDKERILVQRLLTKLSDIRGVEIMGISDTHSGKLYQKGSIVSFKLKKMQHQQASRALAEEGAIGIRFGCFCSHLLIKHILGLPPAIALLQNSIITVFPGVSNIIPGLMRVSLGIDNEPEEIDRFADVLNEILAAPRIPSNKENKRKAGELEIQRLKMVYEH
jgi:selenocysteine lyase/cysteine desulfurase